MNFIQKLWDFCGYVDEKQGLIVFNGWNDYWFSSFIQLLKGFPEDIPQEIAVIMD